MLLLPFVPELLPDELLYSWLARAIQLNALHPYKRTAQTLFGDVSMVVDLPSRLIHLCHVLGSDTSRWNPEAIMERATLYPYHRPFLSELVHEKVHGLMLEGPAMGLKTVMGRVANGFGADPPLRHCPVCLAEDVERFGTPYWHREHQLPGVLCCLVHQAGLIKREGPDPSARKRDFFLPLTQSAKATSSPNRHQIRFAELSGDLLRRSVPATASQARARAYREGIRTIGYSDSKGRIDYVGLSRAICQRFGDFQGFMHRSRLLSSSGEELAWVRPLITRPARSLHPICHLVLIDVLFQSVSGFIDAYGAQDGAVEGAVRSRSMSKPRSVPYDELKLEYDALLLDVTRSCRSVAKAMNVSVDTVVSRRRVLGIDISDRRKTITPDRVLAIAGDLANGDRLDDIAAHHGVSMSTVSRIRASYPAASRLDPAGLKQRLEARRDEWRAALALCPGQGVTATRRRAPSAYAWLHRNDRVWLKQACQGQCAPVVRVSRIDWTARDEWLAARLTAYAHQAMAHPDRRRISRASLLRQVGPDMVSTNLYRLPEVAAALEQWTESSEQFCRFRIERAILRLLAQGTPLDMWRLQRAAGVRQWSTTWQEYAARVIHAKTLSG